MRTPSAIALVSTGMLLAAACGGSDDVVDPGNDGGTDSSSSNDASVLDAAKTDPRSDASVDAGPEKTYKITASVVGLAGTGLVLEDASGVTIPVSAGAATQTVTIAGGVKAGTAYDVSVKTQPSGPPQVCVVTGGKGTVVAGDVTSIVVNCTTRYTVGGTVTGLAGKDLVLQNNAGDDVTLNANGQFAFSTLLADGAPYVVTVKQNPTNKWQTCTVSTGAGGDAGAVDGGGDAGATSGTINKANVTNIAVSCKTNAYPVSVKVTGLKGAGLVLQNNAGGDLPIAADGTFPFTTPVESGSPFAVTVKTQPSGPTQTCSLAAGAGTIAGTAVTVDLACKTNTYTIKGNLSGLQGNGLVLQNNAADDLTLNAAQNGAFSFVTKLESGTNYAVTVKTQPNGVGGEVCAVTLGSGPVVDADITTVNVACSTSKTVFVTSTLYDGNLGGLAGADAKCQARAQAAGLAGTYMAWLSDANASPSTRFTKSAVPYKRVDGTTIANNWNDLVDNQIIAAINKTELNGAPPQGNVACPAGNPTVWTATNANGTLSNAGSTCSNWTSTGGGSLWGRTTVSDTGWSNWCSGGTCSWTAPIYCFQQ
jgi:hypothetical protein